MNLLNPWMLAALAAIAVPIWLHLIVRQHPRGQAFPSLMFARRVATKVPRQHQIRHRLLLALRCLLLIAIVLAFVRPFITEPSGSDEAGPPATESEGASEELLLLAIDVSASMGAGLRIQQAKDIAASYLSKDQPGQMTALMSVGGRAQLLVEPGQDNQARVKRRISTLAATPDIADFEAALQEARHWRAALSLPVRLILITDQAIQGPPPAADADSLLPFKIEVREVGESLTNNLSVTAIKDLSEPGEAAQFFRGKAEITVKNSGRNATAPALVTLHAETATSPAVARGSIGPLESGQEASLVFDIELNRDGPTPFVTVLRDAGAPSKLLNDQLASDNERFALFAHAKPLHVTLVVADGINSGARTPSYVRNALALSKAPPVALEVVSTAPQLDNALAQTDVLILDGPRSLPASVTGAIANWVRGGGGLLALHGTGSNWPASLLALLPGRPGELIPDSGLGLGIYPEDQGHPVGASWGNAMSGPMSDARLYQAARLKTREGVQVYARTRSGDPVIAGQREGGRVLQLATGLEPASSSLGLAPGFATWLIEVVKHLGDSETRALNGAANQRIDLRPAPGTNLRHTVLLKGPGDDESRRPADAAIFQPERPGFYTVHRLGDLGQAGGLTHIALNLPIAEIESISGTPPALATSSDTAADKNSAARERRSSAYEAATVRDSELPWWYLLLAGLLLLALEIFLAPPRPYLARGAEGGNG